LIDKFKQIVAVAPVNTAQAAPKNIANGLLLAAAGAVAFSGKAIIVKLAYRHGVDAVTLIMLRMLFAFPFFVLIAWWASRGRAGARPVPLTRKDAWGVVWLGLTGYYLASTLDFAGLQFISASLERLVLYLNPTLVLLLGWVIYQRRVSRAQVLGMAISYAGVLLVFGHELTLQGSDVVLGAVLVLLSAISYAVYLSYSGEMVQRLGALRLVGLTGSVACVLCVVQFVMLRPLEVALAVAPLVLWLSLLNATVCTVVPVLLVMLAIERIGSGLTAQVGMVGPMSTIAMGVVLLHEPLTHWLVGGTVLVVAGVYVCSRFATGLKGSV
jgi:drug/metabolite transporter (DMT)-like permease